MRYWVLFTKKKKIVKVGEINELWRKFVEKRKKLKEKVNDRLTILLS